MLTDYLQQATEQGASDIFITTGFPVSAKINGQLTPLDDHTLSPEDAKSLVHSVMEQRYIDELDTTKEANFAVGLDGIGRRRR